MWRMGMRVKVRMLGVFRDTGKSKESYLDVADGSNIGDVINAIIGDDDSLRTVLWDKQVNSPLPNALIMLDGVEVNNIQGMETPVSDGQELVLLSVVHGG
jgi:molybdopterin converting factor small subunit